MNAHSQANAQPQDTLCLSHEVSSLIEVLNFSGTRNMNLTRLSRSAALATLAITVGVTAFSAQSHASMAFNTTQNVTNIPGGTYYNTAGKSTTFNAQNASGLVLGKNTTIRGVEVNSGGTATTGNGGAFILNAPNSVVRLDGTVNVNALQHGGAYIGDGGKVTVNSAFLYQSGSVFANGKNGGAVQYNVGAATMIPGSKITAQGMNGAGGSVNINATGHVDVQSGALIDTSGKIAGTVDTNVINIKGGYVNVDGVLNANGISAGANGGTVNIVATGHTDDTSAVNALANANGTTFSNQETTDVINRFTGLQENDGRVLVGGVINANGANGINGVSSKAGDGGNINLVANSTQSCGSACVTDGLVQITGTLNANGGNGDVAQNGGNGGNITVNAAHYIYDYGQIHADGGNGGHALCATCAGDGGNGGTVSLVGTPNIYGNGFTSVTGGKGGNAYAGQQVGKAGNGGNGGTFVVANGNNDLVVDVSGGPGGKGAVACTPCGYVATPPGAPGKPGTVIVQSYGPRTPVPCQCAIPPTPPAPPVTPPVTPPPVTPPGKVVPPAFLAPFVLIPPPAPISVPPASNCVIAYSEGTFPSDVNALAALSSTLCNLVAVAPPETQIANAFLAQEAPVYPETLLRRRLEAEIAEIPKPVFKRPVRVRGYW